MTERTAPNIWDDVKVEVPLRLLAEAFWASEPTGSIRGKLRAAIPKKYQRRLLDVLTQ